MSNVERPTWELLGEKGKNWREARVEFQRRLAFPFACLVLRWWRCRWERSPGAAPCGGHTALRSVDRFVLLNVGDGCRICSRRKAQSLDRDLAGNIALAMLAVILLPRMEQLRGTAVGSIESADWKPGND